MRRARIVLAITLTLPPLVGLSALLRPHTARTVPIATLGATEAPQDGLVVPEDPEASTSTTVLPETTTAPQEIPEPPTTGVPVTTVPVPVTVGTPPTTEPPATTPTTAPPETTTTTEAPITTPTTLGNSFVACYPDGLMTPAVQWPGMDNPSNGPCHLIGTLPDGTTVVENIQK